MDDPTTTIRTATRPVPIGELLDAWLAVQAGDFSAGHAPSPRTATPGELPPWLPCPGEAPVLVVGCAGTVGASTIALLLAGAATRTRVVDCAPISCSGLAGASTAELGEAGNGWTQGRRDQVLIQRRLDHPAAPDVVPRPPDGNPGDVTVIDGWWPLRDLLTAAGWLGDLARSCPRLVLVAHGSVPGTRQLEADLRAAGPERCWAVMTGVSSRQLPTLVEHSLGPLTLGLRAAGRVQLLRHDSRLAMSGITTNPLPRLFDRTARSLLEGLLP
ncbi:MAG: hypothetical protein QM779_11690 [Propionicimonas sp.]|uniref:hypothetical protein n=1 Tax=Propionicimonas sp. TaxID=1955623 RepID=UPI003D0D0F4E